jgi:hypothetical protein
MGDHDAVARVVIFPLSLTSATAHRVTIASARDRRQRQHHGDSGRQARPGNGPYHRHPQAAAAVRVCYWIDTP